MAKMTLSGLASAMSTYVAAAKIAGTYSASVGSFTKLIDKIGKLVTIDGLFNDRLPELDGDNLPLGRTIEEYYIDLILPTAYTDIATEGAKDVVPALPSVENAAYSYDLGKQKIKVTVPFNEVEKAMLSTENTANYLAKIVGRLQNSFDMMKYAMKKELIGRYAASLNTAGMTETLAIPTDTTSGEAFIKQIKADAEAMSMPNEDYALSGALIGGANDLILFIKPGIMPSLEVDTYAGAFNKEELAVPCKIKVLEDFGNDAPEKCFAVLTDSRTLRLHTSYDATRTSENADGDYVNYVRHFSATAFASKHTAGWIYCEE